jgi:hypothetical protein
MFDTIPIKFQWHSALKQTKINLEIHMEIQKTSNSKNNSELKVQCWRHHNTQLQILLQIPNNKKSMILVQKQTRTPMDQNPRPRHKPIQLQPTDLWQRSPKHMIKDRQLLKQIAAGNTGFLHVEDWNWIPFFHPFSKPIQSESMIWNFETTTGSRRNTR